MQSFLNAAVSHIATIALLAGWLVQPGLSIHADSSSQPAEAFATPIVRRHTGGVEAVLIERSTAWVTDQAPPALAGWLTTLGAEWQDLRARQPWRVAVGASLMSSFLVVCGLMMQKLGVARSKDYVTIGSIVLSPFWLTGLAILVFANVFGDYEAYSLAPLSLTAPLSGVTVVLNLVLVPMFLGERIQAFPDVPATMFICVGGVLTSLYGAHDDESLSLADLSALARMPSNICLYGLLLVALGGLAGLNDDACERRALERSHNPRMTDVARPALAAAVAGCLLNLHLKAVAELMKANSSPLSVVLALMVAVPYAVVQVNFTSRGLRLYLQTVFVPVYNSLLMVSLTICASIFYGEGSMMDFSARWHFALGVTLSLVGIWSLTLRDPHPGLPGKKEDPPAALRPGAP